MTLAGIPDDVNIFTYLKGSVKHRELFAPILQAVEQTLFRFEVDPEDWPEFADLIIRHSMHEVDTGSILKEHPNNPDAQLLVDMIAHYKKIGNNLFENKAPDTN